MRILAIVICMLVIEPILMFCSLGFGFGHEDFKANFFGILFYVVPFISTVLICREVFKPKPSTSESKNG